MEIPAQCPNNSLVALRAPVSELEAPAGLPVSGRTSPPTRSLVGTAVLGAGGSALLALASDLPASPFGPKAGAWPFAASGAARAWEGPALPGWAAPANAGPGVPSGHLLLLAAVLLGVALLGVAWFRLWRSVRADPGLGFANLWWVLAAWTAPLLFAAPFASQDAWAYAAQGKAVASGLSAASPLRLLGAHSVWLSGVDPRYRTVPSVYGPGANDLSALFAIVSGGHPWIAVEGWRLAVVGSLVLCGWGVAQIAAAHGGNPVEAVIAGVANPAVLIVFVAGVHNDAVMIGLVVAAIGLAVTRRPWWALGLAALAVSIKAPAALGVVAVAWWCWKGSWHRQALAFGAGVAATVAVLAVAGLPSGGGFSWLSPTLTGNIASTFSILRVARVTAPGTVNLVQALGIVVALGLVLAVARGRSWVGALAIAFAVMALSAAHPQPWYLLWVVPLVACTFVDGGVQRSALVVLCAMVGASVLPFGPLVWFAGFIALAVIALRWRRSWQVLDVVPRAQPKPVCDLLGRTA